MRKYRNLLPLLIHTEAGSYKQGEVFEKDFTPEDEATNVTSGLIEVVPQKYKVIGASRVYDTEPGEEFEAGLTIGQEAALLAGGHVEQVDEKPAPPRKRKKKET